MTKILHSESWFFVIYQEETSLQSKYLFELILLLNLFVILNLFCNMKCVIVCYIIFQIISTYIISLTVKQSAIEIQLVLLIISSFFYVMVSSQNVVFFIISLATITLALRTNVISSKIQKISHKQKLKYAKNVILSSF